IGITDLLMETELSSEQQEYVSIIKQSGDTLLRIINDILDFSKIESGRTELSEEPFSIRMTLSETLHILLPSALEKNLNVTTSVSADVPSLLFGDVTKVRQVMMNLIGNAIKFTPGGNIDITIQLLMRHRNSAVIRFEVSDTGVGVPSDKTDQLFEPFSQVDHVMTRKAEGTGLGLAICRKLVQIMGGEIWYEPRQDGHGSVFVFTAPFNADVLDADDGAASYHQPGRASLGNLRVLIAEDNETNQVVLERMLEKLGCRSTVAGNGAEAVEIAARMPFDLIFLDMQLPVMSGPEVARLIRTGRTAAGAAPPYIVAVTAHALKGDRQRYLTSGMDDYVSKPLTMDAVNRVFEQFTGRVRSG